ncbi:coiled-coil domain-containing protein 106-like, partial [Parambassis ranga]|uniref:Coiled-coil domain-containing protein 106-like n=1 Tax=Parambassis ranga TaxID=210632 RepID=A0A6P7J7S8_9TELE
KDHEKREKRKEKKIYGQHTGFICNYAAASPFSDNFCNDSLLDNHLHLAPTAQVVDRRKTHELDMCKMRMELQKEKIEELTTERDYLKEQLASGKSPNTQYLSLKRKDLQTSWSEHSSSDSSADSSSNTSSSEGERKKKRMKKKGKEKKHRKKSKKMLTKMHQRVQSCPSWLVYHKDCIGRELKIQIKKILRHFKRGCTMSAAFKRVGVDKNTVVVNAPIAELYIAAPGKYKDLLKIHSSKVKLSTFATQCATAILEHPAIGDTIQAFKASGKLLPLKAKGN